MNPKEEQEIEEKVKKEYAEQHNAGSDVQSLYAGIIGGIPNDRDNPDSGHDAVNANFAGGQGLKGSHRVNLNRQTDVELGGLADPGGLDPAMDQEYLKKMKQDMEKQP